MKGWERWKEEENVYGKEKYMTGKENGVKVSKKTLLGEGCVSFYCCYCDGGKG